MATSGTITFNPTVEEIITEALGIVNAVEAGEAPSAVDTATALTHLEGMLKGWGRSGIKLWAQDDAALFLTAGQVSYTIGAGGAANATASYVSTTLSADEASGQTVISVTSEAGISVADQIAVRLDDGTLHWTTVASLGVLTLADALPSAAASGALVYAYTTALHRPGKVLDVRRLNAASGVETPLEAIGRKDYMAQSNKTTTGEPVMVYYEPTLGSGELFVWPAPNSTGTIIRFTSLRPLEDADVVSDRKSVV